MAFDFKKEYKAFYMPSKNPDIIEIPSMNFLAVRGQGNPNKEDGEYSKAVGLLYGMAWTIKMSYKSSYKIDGFFEYVVPPLEGFWCQNAINGIDYAHKENFSWISLIRLPDFVKRDDFDWVVTEATRKKKLDFSGVEFFTYHEGLCVSSRYYSGCYSRPY